VGAGVKHRLRWALAPTDRRAKAAVLVAALPLSAAVAALVASAGGTAPAAAAAAAAALVAALAAAAALLAPAVAPGAMARVERVRAAERELALDVSAAAPPRANIVLPIVDLPHFFGGYLGVFNLARRLTEEGLRVRLVTVDPQPRLPADWRSRLGRYEGLAGALDRIEVEFAGDGGRALEVSPRDSFLAVSAWTARVAHRASAALGRERFVHLIQDYDALSFPNGSMAAVARDSYRLPHHAVFSTDPLREYFRRHRLGVFGEAGRGAEPLVFRSAITPVGPVAEDDLRRRSPGLLFYARPEDHASRNMFELAFVALSEAIAEGTFDGDWRFAGVGSVKPLAPLALPGGRRLELLPREAQADYAGTLRRFTVGLSLMDTPHPSLVPIEMATAGLATVTSVFENKDAATLGAISPNLIGVEPTVRGVVEGLRAAARRAQDPAACARASAVDWPTSWDEALPGEVVRPLAAWLAP
jgi:hypothetical protein